MVMNQATISFLQNTPSTNVANPSPFHSVGGVVSGSAFDLIPLSSTDKRRTEGNIDWLPFMPRLKSILVIDIWLQAFLLLDAYRQIDHPANAHERIKLVFVYEKTRKSQLRIGFFACPLSVPPSGYTTECESHHNSAFLHIFPSKPTSFHCS